MNNPSTDNFSEAADESNDATDLLTEAPDDLSDKVFELLKRNGPLCQSQLSAELLVGTRKIAASLKELEELGIVAKRPDRDSKRAFSEVETPWGIRKPMSFLSRFRRHRHG